MRPLVPKARLGHMLNPLFYRVLEALGPPGDLRFEPDPRDFHAVKYVYIPHLHPPQFWPPLLLGDRFILITADNIVAKKISSSYILGKGGKRDRIKS